LRDATVGVVGPSPLEVTIVGAIVGALTQRSGLGSFTASSTGQVNLKVVQQIRQIARAIADGN